MRTVRLPGSVMLLGSCAKAASAFVFGLAAAAAPLPRSFGGCDSALAF